MIIGINGRINSGKDTIGKIIQYLSYCDTFGRMSYSSWEMLDKTYNKSEWQIKKFADKLKDIVCLLINCTREQLEDREFKDSYLPECWNRVVKATPTGNIQKDKIEIETIYQKMTVRQLLQEIGTEAMRNVIHLNIWVNSLMGEYDKNKPMKFPNWCITDMRFPNEMKAVKDRGGITIRVNRLNIKTITDGDITIKYIPIPNVDYKEHESETTLDNSTFDYEINNFGTIEELIEQVKEILIKEKLIN